MSPFRPDSELAPVCRVPAFAESVRNRVRMAVSAAHPLRLRVPRPGGGATGRHPSPVERVFRLLPSGATPAPKAVGRPGPVRLDAHLHLHLRLAADRRLVTRTVWRKEAGARPGAVIVVTAAPTTVPSVTLVSRATPPPSRAPRASGNALTLALATPGSVAAVPTHVASPAVGAGPSRVTQVLRTDQSASPGPVSSPPHPPPSPVRLAAHWEGEPRTATAPMPLTASDLPGVVDHVVREIDRRVVAARERRGWTP